MRLPAATIAVLALAACTADQPPAEDAAAAPEPAELVITTSDYAFSAPDTAVAGWTKIRLVNEGQEPHHIWLVRLDEGRTLADLMQALGDTTMVTPAWMHDVGGPQPIGQEGSGTAELMLEPGRHAIVCFIPSPDGQPHVAKGMVDELVVVPATGPVAMAPDSSDVVMTLTDYDFQFSAPLVAGTRSIEVRNSAGQPHEVLFVRLNEGTTVQQCLGWIESMEGPPPCMPAGGVTGIGNDDTVRLTLDLEAGRYGLICFVPDAADSRPHFLHGMIKEVDVAAS